MNLEVSDIKNYFKERKSNCNKGDFGKVGILGGSISSSSGSQSVGTRELSIFKQLF